MTLKQPDYILVELMQQYNWSPVVARSGGGIPRSGWPHRRTTRSALAPYAIKLVDQGQQSCTWSKPELPAKYPLTEGETAEDKAIIAVPGPRRTPLVGNIEISIIEEANPRLLTFQEGRTDYEFVGNDLIGNVVQNGKLAPDLAAKGIRHQRD